MTYKSRTARGEFLNLPGHHGGAFIRTYVEDTSERGESFGKDWVQPRVIFEMSDCDSRIELMFEFRTAEQRANTLHKIDTMYEVIGEFRKAIKQEVAVFKKRPDTKDD